MKKALIAFGVLAVVVLALPFIGNSVIQKNIDTKVSELESYGVEAKKRESQSGYFNTTVHFEFVLKNADAFVNYLNSYADNQIPPYVNAMLEGVVIGVDLTYSNFFFANDIKLDIYPMQLSQSMIESLKEEDELFYEYVEKFLASKGILYHINYNTMSQEFDGFVKDIDENQTLDETAQMHILIKDMTFEGEGELLAPKKLDSTLGQFDVNVKKEQESIRFVIDSMKSQNRYDSRSSYNSQLQIDSFGFFIDTNESDISLSAKKMAFDATSGADKTLASLNTNMALEQFTLTSEDLAVELKGSKFAMKLDKLDAPSYERILEIVAKLNRADAVQSATLSSELQTNMTTLLSKGLDLNISDISVEKITLEREDLGGFTLVNHTQLKADKDFAQKMQISPMMLAANIEMLTKLKIAQKLYEHLADGQARALGDAYIVKDADSYVFELLYKEGAVTLNGKPLQ